MDQKQKGRGHSVIRDSLGDRIKSYEKSYERHMVPRTPMVIRVDGRCFSGFLRGRQRPFDPEFINAMRCATDDVAQEMQGFKLAYTQSDEATFMLTDFDNLHSQPWFGGDHSKIVSISAGLFTSAFNRRFGTRNAVFDSRAFTVPESDAANVFIWRQRDWERNSLQMLARAHFSHKQLIGKGRQDLHDMLHTVGVNWADLPAEQRNGTFVTRDGEFVSERADYEFVTKLAGFTV